MKSSKQNTTQATEALVIAQPNLITMPVDICGTAPYVQHKFSSETKQGMLAKQQAGSTGRSKTKKEARDIERDYLNAQHRGPKGEYGIPASAFRSAMISACRLVGFQMTKAKLSVFVLADFFDADDGTPMVAITGEPEMNQSAVRLQTGVASIAVRPMWREWSATINVRFDGDQFTKTDVINLLARAGMQVGVGEGRPDSKKSHGMGWGTFELITEEYQK